MAVKLAKITCFVLYTNNIIYDIYTTRRVILFRFGLSNRKSFVPAALFTVIVVTDDSDTHIIDLRTQL